MKYLKKSVQKFSKQKKQFSFSSSMKLRKSSCHNSLNHIALYKKLFSVKKFAQERAFHASSTLIFEKAQTRRIMSKVGKTNFHHKALIASVIKAEKMSNNNSLGLNLIN